MPDYALRVKASDRIPLRNALVNLGIANWDGTTLSFNYNGHYDDIGPIEDWQNPGTPLKLAGEVLYHYNLRIDLDLIQFIIDQAAAGNATAQAVKANHAKYYAKMNGGLPTLPDTPKRVWL